MFADLHNHTTASDGEFTSKKLVLAAKKLGIKALGISDHDTLDGLKKASKAAKKHGIKLICGTEVSIQFNKPFFKGTVHLLCYFPKKRLYDKKFIKKFNDILTKPRGEKLIKKRIKKINDFFGPNTKKAILKRKMKYEDIAEFGKNITRRHFALSLKKNLKIKDKKTINYIISNKSPAYIPSGIKLKKIYPFIKKEKLLPVLAHPAAGSFPKKGHYKEVLPPLKTIKKLLPTLLKAGIKGLEVYYPAHTKKHKKILKSWADKHNLIVTGGSDCHDKKNRPLGKVYIKKKDFELFYKHLRSK